jgi:hypothetical protein
MALPVMSPAPTNTYIESTAPNVREDLADIVYQIDTDKTPFVSALTRKGANQTLTEWILQEMNPPANVPQPEGFTAAISPAKVPLRLNNVCQILARTVGVSDTLRVVDQVGEEEYMRQLMLRGREIKRDLELTLTGASIKTVADPRALSGFQTWCAMGDVGAGGTVPVGDGSNAHTAGTLRDLTLDMIENGMQNAWQAGGSPSMALMSGNIKRWFSNMAQGGTGSPIVAQNVVMRTESAPVTIMGAVGVFQTDFGDLQIVPDRWIPPHVVELIDLDFVELAILPGRDMVEEQYAKTGDNTQGGMVWEGTLRVTAPKAQSCVWDLNQ